MTPLRHPAEARSTRWSGRGAVASSLARAGEGGLERSRGSMRRPRAGRERRARFRLAGTAFDLATPRPSWLRSAPRSATMYPMRRPQRHHVVPRTSMSPGPRAMVLPSGSPPSGFRRRRRARTHRKDFLPLYCLQSNKAPPLLALPRLARVARAAHPAMPVQIPFPSDNIFRSPRPVTALAESLASSCSIFGARS